MKEYTFLEGPLASNFTYAFEQSLFNLEEHRILQAPSGWRSFYVTRKGNSSIAGHIHFHVHGVKAQSPLRGTFGSMEFSDRLSVKVLYDFMEFVEASLADKGVKNIVIKNPPVGHHPYRISLLQVILMNLGYRITVAEIGALLDVENFETSLYSSEKQKLKKAAEAGLRFAHCDLKELDTVYSFILSCRKERHQDLSMTFDEVSKAVSIFPDSYLLFAVREGDALAAASISVRISGDIVYNLFLGHSGRYNSLSPAVMLIRGICNYARLNQCGILDLGTSALHGKPNFPLLAFKLRLGADPSEKLTFEKQLP